MRKVVVIWFLLASSGLLHAQFVVGGRLCAPDPGCKTDSTSFADTLKTSTAWQWSFGDGGTSTIKAPKHYFRQAGTFNVTLIRTVSGVQETVTKEVTIGTLPPIFKPWKPDTTICPGQKLVINPYSSGAPQNAKYLWYPTGDTTQTITTDSSGCYSVQVTLPNGCSYEDRVKVKVCLEQSNKEGAKWFFGSNAGLDFSGGSPRPLTDGQLNTPEGVTAISNYKGKLLFYTDGISVYDANHEPMFSKDTTKLAGSPNSTQSALIVPQPICRGCEYLYYIFTTSEINGKKQLSYSIVDMRQNQGKGAIVQKNIPVQTAPTTERIVSVRNDKDSTYWIISHDYNNNVFRVYHATNAGLQESGVYPMGDVQNTPSSAEGYMKFSPKNDSTGLRKVAIVIPGPPKNLVQLYDFNDSTGRMSGPPLTLDLGPAPPKAYGVEFSPDGTKLYVSMQGNGSTAAPSKVWQYDLELRDSARISDSKILIDSSATKVYGALQVGSDGKIYLAIKDSEYLGVINDPNQDSQFEVKFVQDGIYLGGKRSQLGLPNFVQNFTDPSDGPGFMYSDTCSGKPTNFQASPLCDPLKDTYTWNFGDGSAPVSSKQQMQAHTFAKAGTYKVSLRLVNQCKDTVITQNVTIIATPDDIKLRSPIDTCVNVLELDAGVKADLYLWIRNGFVVGRTQKISITNAQSGNYTVIAANGEEGQCPTTAQSRITIRKPPAFPLGADTSLCIGTSTGVELKQQSKNKWDEIKWSTGETTPTIMVTKPGTYFAQGKNTSTQCINNDTIVVKALPKARLQASLRPPTACLAKDGNITITGVTPTGTYTYQWFSGTTPLGNTSNVLNNIGQGQYKVQLNETAFSCATDSTFSLQANNNLKLSPTIINAKCTQPTSGLINLTVTGGTPSTFSWTDSNQKPIGTNAPLLDKLAPGKYNVKVTDTNGCEANLNDITVGILPEKFIDLGPDRRKCTGDTVQLTPVGPALAGNVYTWSNAETTSKIVVKQAGVYKVSVTNTITGCKDEDEVAVSFAPRPVYELTKEAAICVEDQGTALLLVKSASNLQYFWIRGERSEPRLVVNQVGSYPIRISNAEGCVLVDTSYVVARCDPKIYVPDVFTPNGDGINDLLELHGNHFIDLEFRIFNRWGELIYFSTDITQKWDGTFRGMSYPPMTYPWLLTFRPSYAPTAPLTVQRGAILLIR